MIGNLRSVHGFEAMGARSCVGSTPTLFPREKVAQPDSAQIEKSAGIK